MARPGKIARLPRPIRLQLNGRLEVGQDAGEILAWLNALPEVKKVIDARFVGAKITPQNLSDWRLGRFQQWLAEQDVLAQAGDLARHQEQLKSASFGGSLADHLGAVVGSRYASILASQGLELDQKALRQLRALRPICQIAVKLRRSEQNDARLQIERERWNLTRLKFIQEHQTAEKEKLRETLAAPVKAQMRREEYLEKLGDDGKAAQKLVDFLLEVEACPDPDSFVSQVIPPVSTAEPRRASKKKPPEPEAPAAGPSPTPSATIPPSGPNPV